MHRSFALLALLPLVACGRLEAEDTVLVHAPFDTVSVILDQGTVEIIGDDRGPARVERDLASTVWNPASSFVEVRDGTLHVLASCDGEAGEGCTMNHRVYVPAAVAASVYVGSGDVGVSGIDGGLAIASGAGDIDVHLVDGDVDVETTEGDISLYGLPGDVIAVTDVGALTAYEMRSPDVVAWAGGLVDVQLVGPVDAVDVRATDDIALRVPGGAYALDVAATGGTVQVTGITDTRGASPLHAWAEGGDVVVVGE